MAAAQALFFDRKLCPLSPLDPIGAQAHLADLQARVDEEHLDKVSALLHRPEVSNFLSAVLELSPYIREVLLDRKSTRLNSSHVKISYAVFCLKKKKIQ